MAANIWIRACFFAEDGRRRVGDAGRQGLVSPPDTALFGTVIGQLPMRLDAIAIGLKPPDDLNVIIEVPIGGEPIKYEMDKAAGTLVVDRFLHTPMRYPGNYGFVPHTLARDGDPLDVLIANSRPIVPGAIINVRPIGVLKMEDDSGMDEKIIAVPTSKLTKHYEHVRTYADLPKIALEQIQHFFEHYKDLEPGKWVKMIGWGDVQEAKQLIIEAIQRERHGPR
jgi:inorganic pyrophosphatase